MQADRRRETCRGDTLSYSVALNTPMLTRPLLMQLADSERPAASTLEIMAPHRGLPLSVG
ncbi:MAG: hypothetical protein JF608_12505 [Sphingomonadales bacterium]|nr:hypothetical protein [Sphingomonadales bacterium]